MPRLFAVQLKDEPAERYEQWVNTPVYTRDYEDCVGWLGCELPEDGHSCEFAELAGDGAVTCASSVKVNRLRDENAKLRELVRDMWRDIPKIEACAWDSSTNTCTGSDNCIGECSYWYRMVKLGIEVDE